jgi:hypothetical protein
MISGARDAVVGGVLNSPRALMASVMVVFCEGEEKRKAQKPNGLGWAKNQNREIMCLTKTKKQLITAFNGEGGK